MRASTETSGDLRWNSLQFETRRYQGGRSTYGLACSDSRKCSESACVLRRQASEAMERHRDDCDGGKCPFITLYSMQSYPRRVPSIPHVEGTTKLDTRRRRVPPSSSHLLPLRSRRAGASAESEQLWPFLDACNQRPWMCTSYDCRASMEFIRFPHNPILQLKRSHRRYKGSALR